jgi:tetratricopeptide (TPR) repeat protein
MMMKLYVFYIRYRLWVGIVLFIFALFAHLTLGWGFWGAFIIYLLAIVSIFGHFFIGPLRLIQGDLEAGNFEGAKKTLDSIWFPALLFKPIRSVYYTLKGNLAMMNQDFDTAEANIKKGQGLMAGSTGMLGAQMNQAQGANNLQLGMIALQKNDLKKAEGHIRQALKDGLPDKENKAMALLQMSSIMMNRREFRAAKDFFKRAKAEKPQQKEIVAQIKEMEKYIGRIPG